MVEPASDPRASDPNSGIPDASLPPEDLFGLCALWFDRCAPWFAALIVAVTTVSGLGLLCFENLSGQVAARQQSMDHARTTQALFFRH